MRYSPLTQIDRGNVERARGGLDLPHRRAHRRSFLRVRGHTDPGRRAAGVLHAVEPRDRPRSRDRDRAVALRSRARSVDLLRQPVRLPRRLGLDRSRGRGRRRLSRSAVHGHQRRPIDVDRRRHRRSLRGIRSGRRSRSHHRRRRDPTQGRLPGDVAARDCARSGHHRIGGQRQPAHRPAERRGARLRRADRRAALGVGRGGAADRGRRRRRAGRGAGDSDASDPAAPPDAGRRRPSRRRHPRPAPGRRAPPTCGR